jgi:uncharacterized RDD family membrane protein YckC
MSAGALSVPVPTALHAPSLIRRMACWLYEGVVLFGVIMLPSLIFGVITNTRNALNHRHELQLLVFVLLAFYFIYFWCKGQTVPMKTWRIRIVDSAGNAVAWPRATLRFLLGWLWFLPPLAVLGPLDLHPVPVTLIMLGWIALWALLSLLRRDRQFLHDAWAGTRLVDATESSASAGAVQS